MKLNDAEIFNGRGAGGWVGDIPPLTEAQMTKLMAFYRKPFAPPVDAKLRELLQAGFRHLQIKLDHVAELRKPIAEKHEMLDKGGKPSTIAREQFKELLRAAETMIGCVLAARPATKSALAASAIKQFGEAATAGAAGRITELLNRLHDDSTRLAVLIERVEIESTPGPANEVLRDFVRSMIQNVHKVTGHIPGRSFQAHRSSKKTPGEGGPFINICREMVKMAVARWPVERRPKTPQSLIGIFRKERETYRQTLEEA